MKSFFITTVLLLLLAPAYAQKNISADLSPVEFKTSMDTIKGAVLLDLRTTDELKQGIIPGATQLDYFAKDFETSIEKLDKEKPYLIYCAAGGRSEETRELMVSKGFKRVYSLSGGFNLWKKKNMPVTPFR
jgi:rhodanese-related sulfurtransferase